jgi:hypothetical protein
LRNISSGNPGERFAKMAADAESTKPGFARVVASRHDHRTMGWADMMMSKGAEKTRGMAFGRRNPPALSGWMSIGPKSGARRKHNYGRTFADVLLANEVHSINLHQVQAD